MFVWMVLCMLEIYDWMVLCMLDIYVSLLLIDWFMLLFDIGSCVELGVVSNR